MQGFTIKNVVIMNLSARNRETVLLLLCVICTIRKQMCIFM